MKEDGDEPCQRNKARDLSAQAEYLGVYLRDGQGRRPLLLIAVDVEVVDLCGERELGRLERALGRQTMKRKNTPHAYDE